MRAPRQSLWVPVLVLAMGCARPVAQVRLDALAAPTPAEQATAGRLSDTQRDCVRAAPILFPGVGPICQGETALGAGLATLGAAELGAAVGLAAALPAPDERNAFEGYGRQVPVLLLQDLWIASWGYTVLDQQRHQHMRYVPGDDFADLAAAPFNPRVLKQPLVWGGTLGLVAGAVAYSALLPGGTATGPAPRPGDPNLFGATFDPGVGIPLGLGASVFLVEHISIAEEIAFRGLLQSALVRGTGETPGWLLSSAIFGAFHATNVLVLPREDRVDYLVQSLPYITLTGTWLGWTYRANRYSLTAPVAIHFWYDLLLIGGQFLVQPDRSIFSARITVPI